MHNLWSLKNSFACYVMLQLFSSYHSVASSLCLSVIKQQTYNDIEKGKYHPRKEKQRKEKGRRKKGR